MRVNNKLLMGYIIGGLVAIVASLSGVYAAVAEPLHIANTTESSG